MIAFSTVFYNVIKAGQDALLEEKRYEKKLDLDLICDQIDVIVEADQDWMIGYSFYRKIITLSAEILDNVDFTYAAAYDDKLRLISNRHAPEYEIMFDPLKSPAFLQHVTSYERGDLTIWYADSENTGLEMFVYYRWVPTDQTLEGRFLLVLALSTDTIHTKMLDSIGVAAVVLIIATTVLNIALVTLLSFLGNVYISRKGKQKWRPKEGCSYDE
jgi:hypothetical protein